MTRPGRFRLEPVRTTRPGQTDDAQEADGGSQADDHEFTYQDDGTVTARHLPTGIVASGTSYAEALVDLTDTLSDDEYVARPIADPAAFLAELDLPRPDE